MTVPMPALYAVRTKTARMPPAKENLRGTDAADGDGSSSSAMAYSTARLTAPEPCTGADRERRMLPYSGRQTHLSSVGDMHTMRRLNMTALTLLTALIALSSAGVASARELGEYSTKDFLSSYDNLEPVDGQPGAYSYISDSDALSGYNKVMIDRIKIFLKDDAKYKGIDPTELKELADYFHDAIVKAVSDAYPVVEEAGPDVVRLRVAVTDLVPNKPEASVVTLVVPFLWVGDAGAGAAQGKAGSTPFVGEASVEMEGLDSTSHEQVAAYISTKAAIKYNWVHGVSDGVESYMDSYSTWAYTKEAMDGWAQVIRERLDKAHGK
jgi:hypothetical protein